VSIVLSCLFLGFECISSLDHSIVRQGGNEVMENDSAFHSANTPGRVQALDQIIRD
jgi:hypothetical protein